MHCEATTRLTLTDRLLLLYLVPFQVHWEMQFFDQELMIGVGGTRRFPLTGMTLGILQDSGWYISDFTKAGESSARCLRPQITR